MPDFAVRVLLGIVQEGNPTEAGKPPVGTRNVFSNYVANELVQSDL